MTGSARSRLPRSIALALAGVLLAVAAFLSAVAFGATAPKTAEFVIPGTTITVELDETGRPTAESIAKIIASGKIPELSNLTGVTIPGVTNGTLPSGVTLPGGVTIPNTATQTQTQTQTTPAQTATPAEPPTATTPPVTVPTTPEATPNPLAGILNLGAAAPATATTAKASDGGKAGGTFLLILVAGLLLAAALLWAMTRISGRDPLWLEARSHEAGEAAYRGSDWWAELRDWLRLGR